MNGPTTRQREIVREALERHYDYTLSLKRSAGVRRYSTKDKHQETLREIRELLELMAKEDSP